MNNCRKKRGGKSVRYLITEVTELVDAPDSKSGSFMGTPVRQLTPSMGFALRAAHKTRAQVWQSPNLIALFSLWRIELIPDPVSSAVYLGLNVKLRQLLHPVFYLYARNDPSSCLTACRNIFSSRSSLKNKAQSTGIYFYVIRKAVKKRKLFPTDGLAKKWTIPVRNWEAALSRFIIEFKEQLTTFNNGSYTTLFTPS